MPPIVRRIFGAILIVAFAKDYYGAGNSLFEAARVWLRLIIMMSLAFTLGVVHLAIATSPNSASQDAVGTVLSSTQRPPVFMSFYEGYSSFETHAFKPIGSSTFASWFRRAITK